MGSFLQTLKALFDLDSFETVDGEHADRAAGFVNGHEVQVIAYNKNPDDVWVKVDEHVANVPLDRVDQHIRSRT